MRHSFVIIDGFYDDPDAIVDRALTLHYRREENVVYPGVQAATFQDTRPIIEKLSQILGGIAVSYAPPQGAFRITTSDDERSRVSCVHLDSTTWSAVVHLSRTPVEGTYIYRHKKLGLDYVSEEDSTRKDIIAALVSDTLNLDAWEVIQEIPMKYNRLLLFDGKHFHSGAHHFHGRTLAEGRLTQHFFIDRVNGASS